MTRKHGVRRIAATAAAAIWAVASLSATASAGVVTTTTIGANSPIASGSTCSVSGSAGTGQVFIDEFDRVPAGGGLITSFAFQNDGQNAGVQVDFKVMREASPDDWVTIGDTGLETLGGDSALDTFEPAAPIVAAPGDEIGIFLRRGSTGTTTVLNDCLLTTTSSIAVVNTSTGLDPSLGQFAAFAAGGGRNQLNLSAQLDTSSQPVVYGKGRTAALPTNLFTVTALADGTGTLTFTDGPKHTFAGLVDCIDVVGNAATIVAHDATTGFEDRTEVQDGGPTQDKLVNSLWDPTTHTAGFNRRYETCSAPDTARLGRRAALAGADPITVVGT
jgi:hypothetical protein